MTTYANRRLISAFTSFSNYASLIVITVGLLVICGWFYDIPSLRSVFLGFATMKFNTAIAFVAAGAALWLGNAEKWANSSCFAPIPLDVLQGRIHDQAVDQAGRLLLANDRPVRRAGTSATGW